MGFSVVIIAFALEDAPRVLREMRWEVTELQVGQPVDLSEVTWERLLSSEHQALNNPHFSMGKNNDYFFIYASLKELGSFVEPDYATLSAIAPLTVHVVVETSNVSLVEFWDGGDRVWSLGGGSGQGYEVIGDVPIDLDAQATAYRGWWNSLPHDYEHSEPGEFDLPETNADLIVEHFSSLTGNYFAENTGFRYDGDHPHLYRLEGDFPTLDTR